MKSSDALNETFNIEPEVQPAPLAKTRRELKELAKLTDNKDKDASYVRAKLYEMTEKLSEAANESLEVAMESSHPRAFEVTANTMKACAEVAEKITDLHKKQNELQTADEIKQQAVIQSGGTQQNIFFQGSTEEMMKMIKNANKSETK